MPPLPLCRRGINALRSTGCLKASYNSLSCQQYSQLTEKAFYSNCNVHSNYLLQAKRATDVLQDEAMETGALVRRTNDRITMRYTEGERMRNEIKEMDIRIKRGVKEYAEREKTKKLQLQKLQRNLVSSVISKLYFFSIIFIVRMKSWRAILIVDGVLLFVRLFVCLLVCCNSFLFPTL